MEELLKALVRFLDALDNVVYEEEFYDWRALRREIENLRKAAEKVNTEMSKGEIK